MKRVNVLVIGCMLGASALIARAQQSGKSAVWKYVDPQTFAIVRLDIARSDYKASEDWITNSLKAGNADATDINAITGDLHDAPARQMLEKLQKAGAKELFGVLTLSDVPSDVGWVVIPIPAGASGEQIAKALVDESAKADASVPGQARFVDGNWVSAVVNDVVFYGRPKSLERISHATPVDRPDLAKALEEAGDAPLVMGLAPSDDTRKVIEQMMPKFPAPIGSSSTVFTRGVRRMSVSVGLPPTPELAITIHSESPEAAQNVEALAKTLLTMAKNDKGLHKALPAADQLIDTMMPKVEGDHLSIVVKQPEMGQLTDAVMASAMVARRRATTVASMSNMRQLGLCVQMYRNDHKNAWPDNLQQTAGYAGGAGEFKAITKDPRWPEKADPYVYIKPADDAKVNNGEQAIVYEAYDTWPGQIGVLFADGHVEVVSDEARVKKMIGEAKSPVGL